MGGGKKRHEEVRTAKDDSRVCNEADLTRKDDPVGRQWLSPVQDSRGKPQDDEEHRQDQEGDMDVEQHLVVRENVHG